MKRITIFSSFCNNDKAIEKYISLYNLGDSSKYNKSYKFVKNNENYTHAIILNTAMPVLNIPKENVIGLAFEPVPFLNLTLEFIEYAKKHIGRYFIGSYYKELGPPFIGKYSHIWHIIPLKHTPVKNKTMSIMISNKITAPGHKYRHELVKHILEKNLPVDIWGHGCKLYNINDSRIKGRFNSVEPYEMYKFHIAVENYQTDYYFSEKITNTLLCSTTPIYLGCKNIKKYFKDSTIMLTGNIEEDIKLIQNILLDEEKYVKKIDINDVMTTINIENIILED